MKLNINGIEAVMDIGSVGNTQKCTIRVDMTSYAYNRDSILTNIELNSIAVILNKADKDIADLLTAYRKDTLEHSKYINDSFLRYGKDHFIANVINTSEVFIGNKININTASSIVAEQLAKDINRAIVNLKKDIIIIHTVDSKSYKDCDCIIIYDSNNMYIATIPFKS